MNYSFFQPLYITSFVFLLLGGGGRGPGGQLYHGAAVSLGGLHLKEDFYSVWVG